MEYLSEWIEKKGKIEKIMVLGEEMLKKEVRN